MYCIKQLGLTTIDQLMVAVVVYPYRKKKPIQGEQHLLS